MQRFIFLSTESPNSNFQVLALRHRRLAIDTTCQTLDYVKEKPRIHRYAGYRSVTFSERARSALMYESLYIQRFPLTCTIPGIARHTVIYIPLGIFEYPKDLDSSVELEADYRSYGSPAIAHKRAEHSALKPTDRINL